MKSDAGFLMMTVVVVGHRGGSVLLFVAVGRWIMGVNYGEFVPPPIIITSQYNPLGPLKLVEMFTTSTPKVMPLRWMDY